jgi:DNA-directed RNA polymerase specialized sigma24 family protein
MEFIIKKKKTHYINNKALFAIMTKFYEDSLFAKKNKTPLPQIPNYVGECFLKLCEKLSSRPNFNAYTYRDEMVADAIENCIIAVHGFNPNKSNNPFAYFTRIAWNAMVRRILKEKKQNYIKHKNAANQNLLLDYDNFSDNILSYNVIEDFEEKHS